MRREESALMESLEGKRGYPRTAAVSRGAGLYGCPTIINNVKSWSAVRPLFSMAAKPLAANAEQKNGGTRLLCVAGHVKSGIYEILLADHEKFITDGKWHSGNKKIKAVI
jgi:NADH-quinone oxidoreductase subunit F